tara:strand:+ start:3390 stop:4382 length:993 start_codon:yes stop_codon:yes gene_type:complete
MTKILITGGCGFIGHNLALHLSRLKYEVTILDSLTINNLYASDLGGVKNKELYKKILEERLRIINENKIPLIIQDSRDYDAYAKHCEKIKPKVIIHLAAVSHSNKSNKDPHTTFDNSLRTLENTLDIAKDNKTQVIYLSSSMVYGDFKSEKVNESTNCNPIGIYGNLKLAGEMILKSYGQVFDLPYTIIRPSALYGERCVSRRVGQIFIESIISKLPIDINGSGEEKLDFTYIDDLVQGITKCIDNQKAFKETFNLTFGDSQTINKLIEILRDEFGEFKLNYKAKEKLTPSRGTLDISKAKKILDFNPNYPIEIGYRKYISWYKAFGKFN